VASLAAGDAFHGFETSDLAHAEELDWVSVPPELIRPRRFVVRVAGDSMEPTLRCGQLAVFESDNPAYEPFTVPKTDSSHPILGCYVGEL